MSLASNTGGKAKSAPSANTAAMHTMKYATISPAPKVAAEQNAILYAAKNGAKVEGSTLYVTLSPCISCARVVYTMKIKKVIYLHSYAEYKGIAKDEGVEFLRSFGVEVEKYR